MAQKSFNEKPCRRESGDERMSRTKCFDGETATASPRNWKTSGGV